MRNLIAVLATIALTLPALAQDSAPATNAERAAPELPRFSAVVAQRYAATLKVLAVGLPDEFKALTEKIDAIEASDASDQVRLAEVFKAVETLRKKYRYKIPYASEATQSAMLIQLANFHETVLLREGAQFCSTFAMGGAVMLAEAGRIDDYVALIDAQSAAYFNAVAAAFAEPDFHGAVRQSDWTALIAAMVKSGASDDYVKALASTDPRDTKRCAALSAMFRLAANSAGPEAERVRSDLAQNAAGF